MIKTDQFMRHMCPRNRGRAAGVIGGRDLDNIAANHIDARQIAQRSRRLPAVQAPPNRRARARRGRGVQTVDVKGHIGRILTIALARATA